MVFVQLYCAGAILLQNDKSMYRELAIGLSVTGVVIIAILIMYIVYRSKYRNIDRPNRRISLGTLPPPSYNSCPALSSIFRKWQHNENKRRRDQPPEYEIAVETPEVYGEITHPSRPRFFQQQTDEPNGSSIPFSRNVIDGEEHLRRNVNPTRDLRNITPRRSLYSIFSRYCDVLQFGLMGVPYSSTTTPTNMTASPESPNSRPLTDTATETGACRTDAFT